MAGSIKDLANKNNPEINFSGFSKRRQTRFELVMKVLQTSALPLGYGAV